MTWEGLSPPYGTIVADPPWQYNVTKGLPTSGYNPYVELFARQPRLGWDHWGHGYEIGEAS